MFLFEIQVQGCLLRHATLNMPVQSNVKASNSNPPGQFFLDLWSKLVLYHKIYNDQTQGHRCDLSGASGVREEVDFYNNSWAFKSGNKISCHLLFSTLFKWLKMLKINKTMWGDNSCERMGEKNKWNWPYLDMQGFCLTAMRCDNMSFIIYNKLKW